MVKFKFAGDRNVQVGIRLKLAGTARAGEIVKRHFFGGTWYDSEELTVKRAIDGVVVDIPIDQMHLLTQLKNIKERAPISIELKDIGVEKKA